MSDQAPPENNSSEPTTGSALPSASSGPVWPWLLGLVVAIAIFLVAAVTLMYQMVYAGHVFLGVKTTDGLELGGLTPDQARQVLGERLRGKTEVEIQLRYREQRWQVNAQSLGVEANADRVVAAAYAVGREGSMPGRLWTQYQAWRVGRTIDPLAISLPQAAARNYVTSLARSIDRSPIDSRLRMGADLRPEVTPSQVGRRLDVNAAALRLEKAIATRDTTPIDLPVQETPPAVAEADLEAARALGTRLLSAPLTLQFSGRTWTLERADLAAMVQLKESTVGGKRTTSVAMDEDKLAKYVARLAQDIDRKPKKPRLEFAGGQVTVLEDGEPGHQVDAAAAIAAIKQAAAGESRTVPLPVTVVNPPGMGEDRAAIKELVMKATTPYGGGLAERRHNIELAAKKLNGVVIGPDEIFSFNEEMGPMTLQAGFKWGWAITQEQGKPVTVPSVAGGICQVATTLFQAAFWAGYQLEERNWHLYWINRYGTPPTGMKGLDATVDQVYDDQGNLVYAVDLKFQNNTPYPVVIQAKTDGNNLTFALYSTRPSWEVKIEGPQIENVVPADTTPVREEDPSLAPGQEIWVETAMEGFKATVVRTVVESGKEPRVLNLVSTYQPARNVVRAGPPKPEPTASPEAEDSPVPVLTPTGATTAVPATTPVVAPSPSPATTPRPAASPTVARPASSPTAAPAATKPAASPAAAKPAPSPTPVPAP